MESEFATFMYYDCIIINHLINTFRTKLITKTLLKQTILSVLNFYLVALVK